MAEPDLRKAHAYQRIAVIGGGSWGTALAVIADRAGRNVRLHARRADLAHEINSAQTNSRYLPDVPLPSSLFASSDLAEVLEGADAALLVVPSGAVREMSRQMAPHLAPGTPVAVCVKGIEPDTGLLMTAVAEAELGHLPLGTVFGPTFAREAALDHPTAATVAFPFTYEDRLAPEASAAARLARSLSGGALRCYISDDVVGVEIGGAMKNVIAIACGMMTGAGFAENTRAALITRGMEEMKSLAVALGGRPETVTGLSGAGDLVLTCSSTTSRNMSLGVQLGQGVPRDQCFEGRAVVVEGEANATSIVALAGRVGVSLPICTAVEAVLSGKLPLRDAFETLWTRPISSEPSHLDIALENPRGGRRAP